MIKLLIVNSLSCVKFFFLKSEYFLKKAVY